MLDWIWCSDAKQKQPMAFLAQKKMSSTSITADDKQNGSEIFGIAVSVRKVNQNSRGSETYCEKKKQHLFVVA